MKPQSKVKYEINGAKFTFRGTPAEVATRTQVLAENGVTITSPVHAASQPKIRARIARVMDGKLVYFVRLNQEHMVASFSEHKVAARVWTSVEGAKKYLDQWSGAGVGMGDAEVVSS